MVRALRVMFRCYAYNVLHYLQFHVTVAAIAILIPVDGT